MCKVVHARGDQVGGPEIRFDVNLTDLRLSRTPWHSSPGIYQSIDSALRHAIWIADEARGKIERKVAERLRGEVGRRTIRNAHPYGEIRVSPSLAGKFPSFAERRADFGKGDLA